MDSHQDYCSYELSKALKAAGFDWPCDHCYAKTSESEHEFVQMTTSRDYNKPRDGESSFLSPICSAVPLWHAQKWLREKKRIAINVIAHDISDRYREGKYHWEEAYLPNFSREGHQWADWFIYGKHPLFDTYEEALSDGLSQMLELIKKRE